MSGVAGNGGSAVGALARRDRAQIAAGDHTLDDRARYLADRQKGSGAPRSVCAPPLDALVDKLREYGWNISRTAEMLDTPRSNLYKKLEQHQISQEKDG